MATRSQIFISYADADRRWAEWVGWQVAEQGMEPLLKAWHAVPGTNLARWLHESVSQAEFTLLLLTEDYLCDAGASRQWQASFDHRDRLLPVQVGPCAPHGLLGNLVSINLVGLDENTARDTLLDGLRTAGGGSAKPTNSPSFPGAPANPPIFPGPKDAQPPQADELISEARPDLPGKSSAAAAGLAFALTRLINTGAGEASGGDAGVESVIAKICDAVRCRFEDDKETTATLDGFEENPASRENARIAEILLGRLSAVGSTSELDTLLQSSPSESQGRQFYTIISDAARVGKVINIGSVDGNVTF